MEMRLLVAYIKMLILFHCDGKERFFKRHCELWEDYDNVQKKMTQGNYGNAQKKKMTHGKLR
jgi:hypothetical protein